MIPQYNDDEMTVEEIDQRLDELDDLFIQAEQFNDSLLHAGRLLVQAQDTPFADERVGAQLKLIRQMIQSVRHDVDAIHAVRHEQEELEARKTALRQTAEAGDPDDIEADESSEQTGVEVQADD